MQEVTVRADGTVTVLDTRTLTTDEDFGEAFICLTPGSGNTVTLLEGGVLSPGPAATALTQGCADGSGGTELVVRLAERVDEQRVFFRYRLNGSLDAYTDVVQQTNAIFAAIRRINTVLLKDFVEERADEVRRMLVARSA